MHPLADLDDVFQSRTHVRVIRALIDLPSGVPGSVREIARRAAVSHPAASRALSTLALLGVATLRRYGRADMYEINSAHRLYDPIRSLLRAETASKDDLVAFLRREIRRRLPQVRVAFLFGSAARGDLTPTSDIDVAMTAPGLSLSEVEGEVASLEQAVRRRFGRRLSVVVSPVGLPEARKPRRPGRELWDRIAREGIPILGPQSS